MIKLKKSIPAFLHILGEPFKQVTLTQLREALLLFSFIVVLLLLLCRCSTNKHVVTNSALQSQLAASHTSSTQLQSIDSLLQTFSISADSVVIVISPPTRDTISPVVRLTAHQPKAHATTKGTNSVTQVVQEKDTSTAALSTTAHSDTTNKVIGVAKPMNGTIVVIIISIATLIILAIFLWLLLKKYRIL